MDFDIAGLLSNPDVLYMMAGLGGAIGKDNPFAVAAGNMTQQGIAAQNQKKLLMALLGQGGGAKGEGITEGLDGWDKLKQVMNAHPDNKMTFDGSKMNITGDAESLNKAFGSGGTPAAPQAPMQTPALSPSSGGQPGILNPSVGLPGDLSGLSLAGLKPEDINKAITLGLTSADLERKKVSDLYQNQYWQAVIEEKRALRGAKEGIAPVEVPGVGQISADNWKNLPPKTQAYAYAMHWRKQNGQSIISPEEFERQNDTNSIMQLVDRANRDPAFKQGLMEYKQAGATNISLGDKAALQKQTNAINSINDLKKPGNSKLFDLTEDEQKTVRRSIDTTLGNKEYDQAHSKALTKAKIDKALALVEGTGAKIIKGESRAEGNNVIITFIGEDGVKDVIRRTIR